ncbi:MAG TPA: hypothetical protein VFV39_03615 [Limnobacter sp.]|nr:hypothetical protein [Limnobacter sp.]
MKWNRRVCTWLVGSVFCSATVVWSLSAHAVQLTLSKSLSHLSAQPAMAQTSPTGDSETPTEASIKMFALAGGVGLKLSPGLGLMYAPQLHRSGFAQSTEGIYLVSDPDQAGHGGIRWFVGVQSWQLQDNRGPGRSTSAVSAGLLFSLSR